MWKFARVSHSKQIHFVCAFLYHSSFLSGISHICETSKLDTRILPTSALLTVRNKHRNIGVRFYRNTRPEPCPIRIGFVSCGTKCALIWYTCVRILLRPIIWLSERALLTFCWRLWTALRNSKSAGTQLLVDIYLLATLHVDCCESKMIFHFSFDCFCIDI